MVERGRDVDLYGFGLHASCGSELDEMENASMEVTLVRLKSIKDDEKL